MRTLFVNSLKFPFSKKSEKENLPGQNYFHVEEDENSRWEWYDPPENSPPVKFWLDF